MTHYLVFDTETTGFKPEEGHRIIELAGVRINESGEEIGKFSSLINIPGYEEIPTYNINKISRNLISDAPYFSNIIKNFTNLANGAILVAHNSGFDLNFLKNEYALLGYDISNSYAADTLTAARKLLPGLESYKLSSLANHFGVEFEGEAHSAYYDSKVTAQVFIKLISLSKNITWNQSQIFNFEVDELEGKTKSR